MSSEGKQTYKLETVAERVEAINQWIARCPEHHSNLTDEERARWASYPALIRSHRYPSIFLDPMRSIAEFLDSGSVGPSTSLPHAPHFRITK